MAARANSFEKQALLSVAAGAVGLFAALGAMVVVLWKLDMGDFSVVMSRDGKAYPLTLAAVAVACLAGAVGFFSGFNSAGNRRNSKSNLSWAGFFLSSVVIVLALSTFLIFWFAREIITVTPK